MSNRNKPASRTKQQVTFQHTNFHQGPLPSPDTLNKYEQIQPGFANRIIKLAEDEATHRRSLERRVTGMNFFLSLIGMIFGLSAIGGVIGLCYYAFGLGFDTAAGSIATVVLIGIGGVFLYRKNKKPD
jgi:uncharacterized membrane protein